MIIGIAGRIGSGKDTIAKLIQAIEWRSIKGEKSLYEPLEWLNGSRKDSLDDNLSSNWQIKKFGYKVKEIASLLTGIPTEDFEKREVKESVLSRDWTYPIEIYGEERWVEMTVRELLQKIGTDALRDNLHPDVWINALFKDYIPVKGMQVSYENNKIYPNWIIPDMRFPNELEAIIGKKGVTIKVVRPNNPYPLSNHPSESSLEGYDFDYEIINDGTIEDLLKEVETTLELINLNIENEGTMRR